MKNRSFNSITFKDVKEFNIIFLILIGVLLVGISGYSSYAIFSDEIVSNNEIKGVVKKQAMPGVDAILEKVGKDGLVAESHLSTSQLATATDYRYTGANPNNYVKFNNETWRIIGVFDVDDGTGKLEKRMKIIRDSIGSIAWDTNYKNNWVNASGKSLLNSGDYYNRTGSYASNGLTANAKSMIANAKWYLGGTQNYTSASNGLASHFYSYERGTTVYSGNPTNWVGKVGLMYISDYGYATSGGATTNRAGCLAKALYNWQQSDDCVINNWLFNSDNNQWTLVPIPQGDGHSYRVLKTGNIDQLNFTSYTNALRPTVYLKSSIQISGGNGSSSTPYELTLPPQSGANTIIDKEGSGGLVSETHPATSQLAATTDYRYTGANPNNYIKFNNETWRIIGVFDTDDGTGKLEKRIKIIRNSLGNISWDNHGTYGLNDWTNASSMTLLNSGDYYNRTGSYASNGLTADAKLLIGNAKWYLGGVSSNYTDSSNGSTSHWYNYERGATIYSGNKTNWVGKVGLMYPSDYGYATSGNSETTRNTCLSGAIFNWPSYSLECINNDWLYNSNNQWTISPNSGYNNTVFAITNSGGIAGSDFTLVTTLVLRPSVYLLPDVKITGGTGTSSDPYTISLSN